MRRKAKLAAWTIAAAFALAVAEQSRAIEWHFSRLWSITRTDVIRRDDGGGFASSVTVDRPLSRWLPLIKFGETVYVQTEQEAGSDSSIFERKATTLTRLVVFGLCSTAKFDELADASFEKVRNDHAK